MNIGIRQFTKGIILCALDWKSLYTIRNHGMLYDHGWWSSNRENSSVDGNRHPIPWYTYPCIDFICSRLSETFNVFEYGCGNSTLWWASIVKEVTSCEHDKSWYDKTFCIIPNNVNLLYKELSNDNQYSKIITEYYNQFNIIIIDGRNRVNCAKNSLKALNKSGVIIWDDTERERYLDGMQYLANCGFKRLDFWGIGPISVINKCTTIFYRDDNCLGI